MVSSVISGYGTTTYVPPTSSSTTSTTGAANAYGQTSSAAAGAAASVNVTLSAEAKAALAAQTDSRTIEAVISAARSALDKLLSAAKAETALKDGKATIDVSGLDRRSLYAIASNKGGKFPIEEQVVASLQMKATRDAALAAPAASMRVTGDYAGLYKAALVNLESAGPEERAMAQWAKDKAALMEGLKQAEAKPGVAPSEITGDPVAAYLKETGGVVANPRGRDIEKVASDVRSVLDKQYATAVDDGAATGPNAGDIDFSRFDDRSLAAVALNKGDQFSEHEVAQAVAEVRERSRASVSGAYSAAKNAGVAGDFGKTLIAQYTAMSVEERDAAGWSAALYDKMLATQTMSDKLASMFDEDGALNDGMSSLLDYL